VDLAGGECPECGSDIASGVFVDTANEPLAPPSAAELAPLFPGLEIKEVVGHGGMGTIYKALQPQLDRLVALKLLSPELSRDPAFAQRFSHEAQALARLNHTNIVRIFDFGRAGGFYYFLMEYVDGVTLGNLIKQRALHPEEAQRIVIEICHALQYAHEEGIVHRDIKPSNILLDKKGRVKIADFGLAQLVSKASKGSEEAQPMMIMGTPRYMAPEQLDTPWKVDRRADLYSVGVLLYEILTGELPQARFELPSRKAGADPLLDEIVYRALARQPRRRYQSAEDMRAAVEAATGRFHNLPGDMQRSKARRKWRWLPRFALGAMTIWVAILTYALVQAHRAGQASVLIPAGALEAFAAGPEGVGIARRMAADLNLTLDQVQNANSIVRRYQRDFLELEQRHMKRFKNPDGHEMLTIQAFPQDMDDLMNRMWVDLGGVLSGSQLAKARDLHFEKLFPHSGKKPLTVEFWQDENGEYHYAEVQQSSAASMPMRYRNWFLRNGHPTNN
jgi:predicted Ser/Thr protein kinase